MKVFYYSELLDKYFETEQACLNAEKATLDAEKRKNLANDAVETAKENVRKAERNLQKVCDQAQEVYDKRIVEAEKEFEGAVSTAKSDLVEAKKQLKSVLAKYDYNETIPEGNVFRVDQNKLLNQNKFWEDLKKEVLNGSLWDLFTY